MSIPKLGGICSLSIFKTKSIDHKQKAWICCLLVTILGYLYAKETSSTLCWDHASGAGPLFPMFGYSVGLNYIVVTQHSMGKVWVSSDG